MAASVYAHSCFVRSAEIYFNLRILLRVFYFEYFMYICILSDTHVHTRCIFFLRLCVRNFPDRLEFCREWFGVNFSRLTVVFNWSKYIYILHINHSFKYLTTKHEGKNQFGNFREVIADYYLLHSPYLVRSVGIFLSTTRK